MKTHIRHREVRFCLLDGHLVRTVAGDDGRTYTHRCTRQAYETVAHAIDEIPAQGAGTTLAEIARAEDLPFTQVNVTLEFMNERGIIDVRHRWCYPGTTCTFEDAMVEFYALTENG